MGTGFLEKLESDRVTSIHLEKKLALSPAVHDDFHADVAGFSPYGLAWIGQNIARKHLTKSINEILVPLSNETNFAIKHIFGESPCNLFRHYIISWLTV
ncbi:hypothetical protein HBI56_065600 [Parastagonospora nodorum]|uniref:Uncharacterized protein n=1 Tax=Phaeosphaeria nodorum (strain SN15 / ATCC MYA-4574 / FGSC 10173) TaxID=321614 RepID=A0A7U2END5_PHANO|nr:hypothetical protein HBH56_000250 [Parastagonospora nodorum]QRC90036.1 hypothetical protein JI435_424910 [Parastagonospora nodorum SN15]KAH3937695.1 hypothetical protein HBH54_000260 [Parastagonospora nodorum]KAH3958458.1 hypothetical protein HBH51_208090 [Parastagonospora nodorum]KAH4052749.1 hypothetical protein HBH49_090070 [Parastagonospora nodorum]